METIRTGRVRIKKGVRPYGGRRFMATLVIYPNGRKSWLVDVASSHKAVGENWVKALSRDEREYNPSEIEEITS
ncbi:MAG: hypothetical protein DRQ48_00240 [Gammaproteobacteria bacterium]|nr:MAG: hypothetical protein DRQ48_00240 [Gammaproteobacteria bacterium]